MTKTYYNPPTKDGYTIKAGNKINLLAAMHHIVRQCIAYIIISIIFIVLGGLAVSPLKGYFLGFACPGVGDLSQQSPNQIKGYSHLWLQGVQRVPDRFQ